MTKEITNGDKKLKSRKPLQVEKRQAAGEYLKKVRIDSNLTQRELAIKVGFDYYTFISQLEGGHGRLPDVQWAVYADACGVSRQEFCKNLLFHYQPEIHAMLNL